MANPYDIRYRCSKCRSLQIIGERVNFGTTNKDLDGKTVIDAYRIASHSIVPQKILELLKPDLRCRSCHTVIGEELTVADLVVKRP